MFNTGPNLLLLQGDLDPDGELTVYQARVKAENLVPGQTGYLGGYLAKFQIIALLFNVYGFIIGFRALIRTKIDPDQGQQ